MMISLKRLVDLTVTQLGRVDVLVNSAGHGPRGPLLELSDDDWHQGMDVYFLSAVRPTRLVTPIMQQQQSGVIINISTLTLFTCDSYYAAIAQSTSSCSGQLRSRKPSSYKGCLSIRL